MKENRTGMTYKFDKEGESYAEKSGRYGVWIIN